MGEIPIDNPGFRAVTVAAAGRVRIHPSCDSRGGLRWYCAASHYRREIDARDGLEAKGFAAFVPTALVAIRHARKTTMALRPVFPGYLFVALDLDDRHWRNAAHSRWIGRLFGPPERPIPIPVGLIETMIRVGFDRPITEDIAPALIAAGAAVRIADGPFTSFDGICQWDDGTRIRVLASIFGRSVPVELDRDQVEPIK